MIRKIHAALMWVPDKSSEWLSQYPTLTNILLIVWNAFMASWATGIKVPVNFDSYGLGFLDFTVNARVWVTNLQYHVHLPTWTVAVLTVAINGLVAYGHWRQTHPKSKESNTTT